MAQSRRRAFLVASMALLAAPRSAYSQQARPRRVGLLFGSTRDGVASEMATFVERLRELGLEEGKNLQLMPRFAGGVPARLPDLARELADANVEVVFVPNTQGALALQAISQRVAIIFVTTDPVKVGLVDSLARPGRNATGFTQGAVSIAGKRVELIRAAFPSVGSLGVLADPKFPVADELAVITDAARMLSIQVRIVEASTLEQYVRGIKDLQAAGVAALYVVYTGTSFALRRQLADAVRATPLPAIYGSIRFAEDGGLIAYSWQTLKVATLAAEYAHRILQGTRPADLPVQEPTEIELVVNLATARAQGLSLDQSILLRAIRVIE